MKAFKIVAMGSALAALAACSAMPSTTGKTTSTQTAAAKVNTMATTSVPDSIDAVVNAYLVRTANGQETLEPITTATVVKSGDVVEYQTLLTNTGTDRVRSMTVTLSLPEGAVFTGQADPALGTLASADGARFVRMPIRTTVNGATQNLPFDRYQALRWTIEEIGLGGTAVVKYRATIR
ncbi:hypothetical protein [uncultured Moraxella sp.]|uniref:hypothetical protein n=1 Tax=uncultured Moraxella sp. TaxID=263769 RepID=UPI0025E7CA2E|nr:hypothetical protein [uncultured Moraxella sp.]